MPEALFVNRNGTRLTARHPVRMKQGVELGLAANVHPHVLRHSFASRAAISGDFACSAGMLGHASTTTQVYTHLDFQQLAKVYDGASAREAKSVRRGGATRLRLAPWQPND
jgi:integrase/recombinase XerC